MKSKTMFIITSVLLSIFSTAIYAQGYYSSQTYNNNSQPINGSGYYSSQGNTAVQQSYGHHRYKHHRHNHIAISVGAFAVPSTTYVVPAHVVPPYFPTPTWINSAPYSPFPAYTVVGGGEPGRTLFVCRGYYKNNLYPGKLINGRCNITWDGHEIALSDYQLLVSNTSLSWVSASHGFIPFNALPGGYEYGQPLFICQAQFRNGLHPGKIVSQMCHISWGGKEFAIPYYNVLVS